MKYQGLFPNDPQPPKWEALRVLKRGPEYTTLLVLRTAGDPEPKRWHLLTQRLPSSWVEGFEGRMGFTPMELEWLQGFRDLHKVIAGRTPRAARSGEVIAYAGPELPYKAVLHAVAVDGWYHAIPERVRETMATALRMATELAAKKVTLTALATGFGDLTLPDFANALRPLMSMNFPPIEEICLCLMEDYRLAELANSLASGD